MLLGFPYLNPYWNWLDIDLNGSIIQEDDIHSKCECLYCPHMLYSIHYMCETHYHMCEMGKSQKSPWPKVNLPISVLEEVIMIQVWLDFLIVHGHVVRMTIAFHIVMSSSIFHQFVGFGIMANLAFKLPKHLSTSLGVTSCLLANHFSLAHCGYEIISMKMV